jgi:hypothetical protein
LKVSASIRRISFLAIILAALGLGASPAKPKLWSLQPVVRPEVPVAVTRSANPIDAFIAAQYKEKKLHAAGTADKATLLRRVYFDLIGIPPSPAEQDAFLKDESSDAYEKVVDKLLANEQYGVRWTRHWLDVLRYADLDGLDNSVMPAAPGIYLWRDWVIAALNDDMPYDEFARAQILGSRYRDHTTQNNGGRRTRREGSPEDQFALGFLARAAITRNDKDQDLALAAVETISTAFMGMTVGCAKCHDHKFDPITQKDFYSMKALFDPLVLRKVMLATPADIFAAGKKLAEYQKIKAPIDDAIEALIAPYRKKLYDERVALLTPDVQAIIRKPERQRTVAEDKIADDYFPVLRIDPSKLKQIMPQEEIAKYNELTRQQRELGVPPQLPAYWTVEEDSARLKQTSYILTSGDPNRPEKDKPVGPGFPFKPQDVDFRDGRREGFVDWLTAPDNPLFARVAVNRIWQWHFGEGLQRVPSDFGMLGGKPTDQKLLDYLAAEFVTHDYSMKWLHRLMVTSDTYKLASKVDPKVFADDLKADPQDAYLWRFRLQRLEAEQIWDAILYVSNDLDLSVGGRSFQLAKPDERQVGGGPRAVGANVDMRTNRRGIYMQRGYIPSTEVMSNFLLSFDVDDGRTPCPIRGKTVTAPQALFSMNDETIEKHTTKLAEQILAESSGDIPAAVDLAYRITLARAPSPAERDEAFTFLDNNKDRMQNLAWLLFNLDEFLYVR